jgi:hypothetical protein
MKRQCSASGECSSALVNRREIAVGGFPSDVIGSDETMKIPVLNWCVRPEGFPLLANDLRNGRAGFGLRLALSIAALGLCIATMLAGIGVIHSINGRVEEEHAFIGMALAGVGWCSMLAWLWGGYRKWHRALRTTFGLIGLWALVIPVSIGFGTMLPRGEFLVAACIVLGLATTLAVIATVAYRSLGGRPVCDVEGRVQVQCPKCGYSMIGLETCQCPECGHRCTIDKLIAAQDYSTLRNSHDQMANEVRNAQLPPVSPAVTFKALPATRSLPSSITDCAT